MSESPRRKSVPSLCWDCANATGNCRWSKELKPVKGWKGYQTKREAADGEHKSFLVIECPEFKRDAACGGLKRIKGDLLESYYKGE